MKFELRMKTRLRHLWVVYLWGILCNWSASTWAQQVVQQPTVGTLSINSSVLVPDQGSALLGSVRSSGASQSQRGGMVTNRAIGSRSSAGGASVTATIIDLQEMDRAILALADGSQGISSQSGFEDRTLPTFRVHGMSDTDREDVHYFLTLAQNARRSGHWASVEVYLGLAKSKIPLEKQSLILSHYGFGKAGKEKASQTNKAKSTKQRTTKP